MYTEENGGKKSFTQSTRQKCDLLCTQLSESSKMEAARVAVAFLLVEALFICLHLQIQILYYVEEQRHVRAQLQLNFAVCPHK